MFSSWTLLPRVLITSNNAFTSAADGVAGYQQEGQACAVRRLPVYTRVRRMAELERNEAEVWTRQLALTALGRTGGTSVGPSEEPAPERGAREGSPSESDGEDDDEGDDEGASVTAAISDNYL